MIIKSSCLVVLFAFVAVVTNSVVSYAMSEKSKSPDEQQQEVIAKFEESGKLQKQPDCVGPLELTIANTKFRVIRYSGSKIRLADGTELDRPDKQCNLVQINNVRTWSSPGFGLSDVHLIPDYKSTYSSLKERIEIARAEGKSVFLENGLERIFYKGNLLYVIPLSIASAYNNEPIVFDCNNADPDEVLTPSSTSNCGVSYQINENITIGYSFFRKKYPDQNLIQADKEKREFFESLIINGE